VVWILRPIDDRQAQDGAGNGMVQDHAFNQDFIVVVVPGLRIVFGSRRLVREMGSALCAAVTSR
jgi:hypothetical protein